MEFRTDHKYGNDVHIVDDPLALTLLSRLCAEETVQPAVNQLVATLYRNLVCSVISRELPRVKVSVPTRMVATDPEAVWHGEIIAPKEKVIVLCVARAGIFPSQVCFDFLNEILDPSYVRQDHMFMNRTTDEEGQVSGAAIHGAKIGGPVDGATLFIPDPMGATGATVDTLLNYYKENVEGTPARVVALNLIVTPEYLRKVREIAPEAKLYAYRVDRGLSPADVLAAAPGEHWDRERGLNDKGYIVPGGGGFGEVMNNAFV